MLDGRQAGAVDGGWNKDAECGSCQGSELTGSAMCPEGKLFRGGSPKIIKIHILSF